MATEKVLKILMLEDLQDDVGLIECTLRREGMNFCNKRVDSQDDFTECLSTFGIFRSNRITFGTLVRSWEKR